MASFLKQLFAPKTKLTSAPVVKEENYPVDEYFRGKYDYRTISPDEMKNNPRALIDIYEGKVHGFLIKDFLSKDEVALIMSNFDQVISSDPTYIDVGFTYPAVFANFSNSLVGLNEEEKDILLKEYFDKNVAFGNEFNGNFKVNVKKRIEELFNKISGGLPVSVAPGVNNNGTYPFSTFRYLVPDKGLMSLHCGNLFGFRFKKFYEDLTKKVAVTDQMSFFIMLQTPEIGGELTLYNLRWKEGQVKPDDDNITLTSGHQIKIEGNDSVVNMVLNPQAGDMILFQGGNIWHRVETVKGKTPRITLGGFIGISKEKDKFHYWS